MVFVAKAERPLLGRFIAIGAPALMLFRLADGNECLMSGVSGSLEGFLYDG